MHNVTLKESVLWNIRCGYYAIPMESYRREIYPASDVGFRDYYPYVHYGKRRSNSHWDFLHKNYYLCNQIWRVFEGSFEEFIAHITKEFYYNPYNRSRHWNRRWRRNQSRTGGYLRKPHHIKKILSEKEIVRKDWREKKQFRRDKAKNGWSHRGPSKSFKKISNNQHRCWEKNQIHNENWDIGDRDYKYFLDPWLWD